MKGDIINKDIHRDIYNWLSNHVYKYKENQNNFYLHRGYICTPTDFFIDDLKNKSIPFPIGYVGGVFSIHSTFYNTLDNLPLKVGKEVCISNKILKTKTDWSSYNLYVMAVRKLLQKSPKPIREFYLKNYKNKRDEIFLSPIIPIDILTEYGF